MKTYVQIAAAGLAMWTGIAFATSVEADDFSETACLFGQSVVEQSVDETPETAAVIRIEMPTIVLAESLANEIQLELSFCDAHSGILLVTDDSAIGCTVTPGRYELGMLDCGAFGLPLTCPTGW